MDMGRVVGIDTKKGALLMQKEKDATKLTVKKLMTEAICAMTL